MTTDTVGGVFTYALELASALEDFGVEVLLATMGPLPTSSQRQQLNAIRNLRVFESTYKLEWMDDPWTDVQRAGEWLLDLEHRFRPDIVHVNGYAHAAQGFRAPVLSVAHSCVLSWWDSVHHAAAPSEWQTYATQVKRGLLAADVVVAPTSWMMSAIEQHYGPMLSKVVIPNGRSAHRFRPGRKLEFVMTAGRLWDEAKNVKLLAQLAPELQWPVMAAGTGCDNRGPNFRPLGNLCARSISAWMSASPIYAMPALYEPFGLSVLEAALSGNALVLGDIASLRENWEGAALFVPPDDAAFTTAAINRIIEDVELRHALQREAHRRALSFSTTTMAKRYLSLYRSVSTRRQACVS
jgi:glycosyltransferase involved in cell wall biosynthesis